MADKKRKILYVKKIRAYVRKEKKNTPVIESLLDELERIETIRNDLYEAYENGELLEEYTNKAGATNTVVNAAVKEYKAYSQRFNDLTKTIVAALKEPDGDQHSVKANSERQLDDFQRILLRGKANGGP